MADQETTPDKGGDDSSKEATFTQADLDRVVQDRLNRERQKYADYDEVKRKALELEEIQEASQSEHEKALKRAVNDARKEERGKFEQQNRSMALRFAVAQRAREVADAEDVLFNLERADTQSFFDDEGRLNEDEFGTAFDGLLERKPHLRAGEQQPVGDVDQGKGAAPSQSPQDAHNDVVRQMLGLG